MLLPNPRGSYGQGEDFTRANVKDFGGGDLRDDLAGVDAAIKKYPIDPDRLGVTGWSYGGFMTMWTVTQTDRFRAAVAGAGIANWQSYYGQNLIDQWMIPFFGASVYDDPAVYEKSSPIRFIKNVKTPTLVIVGERDAECPASQSYEFWHALKTLGVPTQLIIYPGEGHLFHRTEEPSRSTGADRRMVRQIFEVTEFSFPVDRDRTRKEALSSLELRFHGPSLRTDIRRALLFLHHDRSSHLRVNRAKVFIGAWRTGDDREFLIGVEPR